MSSRTHDSVRPVVGALYFFRQGLVWSSVLFVVRCVVGDPSRVVHALYIIFVVVVGTEFACRWGVFVSLTGPVHVMSRFQLSVAIAVLFLSMWRDRSVSVRDFRRPYPSRRPDQIVFGGSWYHTNWAFDRQVRTLHAFLDSDLGADSRRLGGDIVES